MGSTLKKKAEFKIATLIKRQTAERQPSMCYVYICITKNVFDVGIDKLALVLSLSKYYCTAFTHLFKERNSMSSRIV